MKEFLRFNKVFLELSFGLFVSTINLLAQSDPTQKIVFHEEFTNDQLSSDWKLFKAKSFFSNGALVAYMPDGGDHNAVFGMIMQPVSNLNFSTSFLLDGAKTLAITFNDSTYKGSHAGHLIRVALDLTNLTIKDEKTGIFRNDIFEMKKKDEKTLAYLKTKEFSVPLKLVPKRWYPLEIKVHGESLQVFLDSSLLASFSSEGIAHSTKDRPAFVVSGKYVQLDHVRISVSEK